MAFVAAVTAAGAASSAAQAADIAITPNNINTVGLTGFTNTFVGTTGGALTNTTIWPTNTAGTTTAGGTFSTGGGSITVIGGPQTGSTVNVPINTASGTVILGNAFNTVGNTAGGTITNTGTIAATGTFTNIAGTTVNGLTNTVGNTVGGLATTVGNTVTGATTTVGNTVTGVTNTVGGAVNGLTGSLGGTVGGVTSISAALVNGIGLPGISQSRVVQLLCGTAAAGSQILSASEASNSVFLTQSTAFVSAPANPRPDSEGGGVWVRAVGGEVQYTGGPTLSSGSVSISGAAVGCPSGFQQGFGGFQVGQDLARLNVMGWNIHAGQTAGYVGGSGNSTGGSSAAFGTSTQIPFVGAYVAATNGGLFADALVRMNWYENLLNSPGIGLNSQKLDAHGVSASASLGYHWDVPGTSWFAEPSIGAVWSRTSIDPLNVVAVGPSVDGNIVFKTIDSLIGRAGLRVGTTVQSGNMIYQPFVAVSAWHEFDGNIQASFSNSAFATVTVPGIGTYGQYSIGANGQIAGTGWLGYARVDYRNGDHIDGWSGTGGIRYQFSPDGKESYKAPANAAAADFAPRWTGFYAGGFAGAAYGSAKMGFPGIGDAGPQMAGALAGGTLGYNYQMGSWVVGVEGDAGWTNARGSVACTGAFAGAPGGVLSGTDCADKADFIATATARLGYAWGHALYYAKAGGAWTHEAFSVTCNNTPGTPCLGPTGAPLVQTSAADDRLGWTAGYGVEFALTQNWSAKGEVNYIDFGSRNLTTPDGAVINAGIRTTEGKIGLNYRF
jgi:opacity protein-like surface antigen